MKVVLKKAVVKLGLPGDIVKVKDGFATNWLIPQGFALYASKENLEEFEKQKEKLFSVHEQEKLKAVQAKEALEGQAVILEKAVNDAGNLYAVISPADVSAALNEQFANIGIAFLKNQINISNKIRNYGVYDFIAVLYNGVTAKMKLSIHSTKVLAQEALKPKVEEKPIEKSYKKPDAKKAEASTETPNTEETILEPENTNPTENLEVENKN